MKRLLLWIVFVCLSVSAQAQPPGVASCQYLLDGQPMAPLQTGPCQDIHWNTLALTDGPHHIIAKAKDFAGNEGVAMDVTVTVDNTPPVIALTTGGAPIADGATFAGKVNLTASASDATSPVSRIELWVNGSMLRVSTNGQPIVYTWNTAPYKKASPKLMVTATDKAGNQLSKTIQVTVP